MEFFAPETAPFAVALCLTLAIALLEGIGLALGFGASHAVDGALPDLHADAADGASGLGHLGPVLDWLSFGRVPALALIVIFTSSFGLFGFAEQKAVEAVFGAMLDPWIASLPALAAGLFATRWLGRLLARILPRDHTEAVSTTGFVGRVATVIRGEAQPGRPAEAKLKDEFGKTHYLLVEPQEADEKFGQGSEVVIIRQDGGIYRAITRLRPT